MSQGLVINDWADDNFDHSGLRFHRRRTTVDHEVHPIAGAAILTLGRSRPGPGVADLFAGNAGRWVGACVIQRVAEAR